MKFKKILNSLPWGEYKAVDLSFVILNFFNRQHKTNTKHKIIEYFVNPPV